MDIKNKTIVLSKDTRVVTNEKGEIVLPVGTTLRVVEVKKNGVVLEVKE